MGFLAWGKLGYWTDRLDMLRQRSEMVCLSAR